MKEEMLRLREWIGEKLIDRVDDYRRRCGDMKRERKLGTSELLCLFIGLSLNCRMKSLHELLRTSAAELELGLNVSVGSFCKARRRFSPQASSVCPKQAGPPGRASY